LSILYPKMDLPNRNTTMFPGPTTGIDLRAEMDSIMEEYGSYILVRHFDRTQHSSDWDPIAQEGVGGPGYTWVDYITLARKVIRSTATGSATGLEQPAPMGLVTVPIVMFYIKWNTIYPDDVSNGDMIMEFPWDKTRAPVSEEAVLIVNNSYEILEAADLLGDKGRREYYMCVTRTDIGGR